MKSKVKKFGRGGDILTGLGAGLLGYAAYKALNKDKDKDDDYTRRVKEFGRKGDYPDAKKEEKADDKKAEAKVAADKDEERDAKQKRALDQSKNPRLNLVPEGADKDVLYESDKALVRTDGKGTKPRGGANKPKPRLAPKAQVDKSTDKSVNKSFSPFVSGFAPKADTSKAESVSRSYPINSKPNEERSSKTTPMTVREAADKPANTTVPKSFDLKGTNKTVYGTDTTSVFQKRAAEQRAEQEAKAKKAAKDKADAEEFRNRPLQPMRKGGAVKKMASGGMARSSASKRADGCAIRGKTRA
jgi:hypothetical protein